MLPGPDGSPGSADEPGTGVGVGRNVAGPPLGSSVGPGLGTGWQLAAASAAAPARSHREMTGRVGARRRRVAVRTRRRV